MNASSYFYCAVIELDQKTFKTLKDLVDLMAFDEFECSGLEEINIEQETVNKLLREKAVGGGELPPEAILEVEKYYSGQEKIQLKYFFEGKKAKLNAEKFCKFIKKFISDKVLVQKNKNQDWNSEWKKHYNQIEVGSKIKVVPSFQKNAKVNKSNEVYIYPGMGFGTGSHETTFMCISALLELEEIVDLRGKVCLDFGCGSGILGISAMKQANMVCDFCDIDKNALQNTLQNLLLNFTEHELEQIGKRSKKDIRLVSRDRFKLDCVYDLVFANILENIIIEEYPLLEKSVRSGGYVVVSGILNEQVDSIEDRFVNNGPFSKVKEFHKGEWAAIIFERK